MKTITDEKREEGKHNQEYRYCEVGDVWRSGLKLGPHVECKFARSDTKPWARVTVMHGSNVTVSICSIESFLIMANFVLCCSSLSILKCLAEYGCL